MAATKKDPRSAEMKAVIEVLTKKFDDDKILSRKGQGNKTFNYVKAQEYIVKLNEAFGVAWGVEVKEHFLVNNQVVMCVSITVTNPDNNDTYIRDGWGSHPLGQDVGNSFKSAYSKAFTKAASMVGAGLHLWGVDSEEDDVPTWENMQATPANVTTVVTPGSVPPAVPPLPGAQAHGSTAPPVPTPPGVTPPAGAPTIATPQFSNPRASGPAPPPPPPGASAPPPPPVPTGNPNPASAIGGTPGVGPDGKPLGPATAAIGVQSTGSASNKIQDFQINGITGAAMTRGLTDPMQLVQQILGDAVQGLTINDLSLEQAQSVLDAARSMPPQ